MTDQVIQQKFLTQKIFEQILLCRFMVLRALLTNNHNPYADKIHSGEAPSQSPGVYHW